MVTRHVKQGVYNLIEQYDVAIVGTGIGGGVIGAILARHNFRVVMIEKSAHPRFAIGESVLPKTALLMRIIGEYYDVPEIAAFGDVESIKKYITKSCGVKRLNGYLYHHEEQKQNPAEAHLFVAARLPLGDPPHLFRQDVDLFMVQTATRYGAVYHDKTRIDDIQIDKDKVTLTNTEGACFHARFLIDGAGLHSPIADKYQLRREQSTIRTHSRAIFTHMENVPHYENLIPPTDNPGLSYQWSDGTLHHIFDGGWLWVIPFNNLAGSTNRLCSVGISVDINKFPDTGMSAEEEFQRIIERFPGIAMQFAQAKAVRPWIKTPCLQYTSRTGVGDRFYLLPNSHSFTDALHSRGLICTFESIHRFVGQLMIALTDDDLTAARFADIDTHHTRMAEFVDRQMANFYASFADFSLWNVWLRMHVIFEIIGFTGLVRCYARYLESGDRSEFKNMLSVVFPEFSALQTLFDQAEQEMQRFGRGELTAEEVSNRIYTMLRENEYLPPVFDWTKPEYHHIDSTPRHGEQVAMWAKNQAPVELWEQVYNFDRGLLGKLHTKQELSTAYVRT